MIKNTWKQWNQIKKQIDVYQIGAFRSKGMIKAVSFLFCSILDTVKVVFWQIRIQNNHTLQCKKK